jgi:hypothetical protein
MNRPKLDEGLTLTEERVETERGGVTSRIFDVCSNAGQAGGRVLGEAAIGTAKFVAKTTFGIAQGIFDGLKGKEAPKTHSA